MNKANAKGTGLFKSSMYATGLVKMWFVVLSLVFAGGVAKAEQWILKNPTKIAKNLKVVRTLTFGENQFVVVDGPKNLNIQSLQIMSGAQNIQVDPQIGLMDGAKSVKADEGDVSDNNIEADMPWYQKRLDYAQLNTKAMGQDVIVAVLDTGLDRNHKAFKGAVWTNTNEIPDNGIDDDQNGLVDDYYGYNFVKKNNNNMDDNSHGTHCAGLIAARKVAGSPVIGAAPEAKIMSLKVIDEAGPNFLSGAAEAMKYAVDHGAKVLSNSWRVYLSWGVFDPNEQQIELLRAAIQYAIEKGAIVVVAAGNESKDIDNIADKLYPPNFDGFTNLIKVGSTQTGDTMSSFSNWGSKTLQIAAPGSSILSTVPDNSYEEKSGTSMATPIVAGMLARAFSMGMSSDQIVAKMEATSEKWANLKSKMAPQGGFINPVSLLK